MLFHYYLFDFYNKSIFILFLMFVCVNFHSLLMYILVDIEGYFLGLMFVIQYYMDSSKWTDAVKKLINGVENAKYSSFSKLKLLSSMFNMAESVDCKYYLIMATFNLAKATKQCAAVFKFHVFVENWIATWKLTVPQQRQLYRVVSEIVTDVSKSTSVPSSSLPVSTIASSAALAVTYWSKYVLTFITGAVTAAEKTDFTAVVSDVIVQSIQSDSVTPTYHHARNDLYRSIKSLPADLQASIPTPLTELLLIVCTGSLSKFNEKYSSSNVFTTYDINKATVVHVLKLLSICALVAANQEHETICLSFQQIKEYLNIDAGDEQNVEFWVVEAISYELIEASINQIDENVTVSRYAHFQQHGEGDQNWNEKQLKQLKHLQSKVVDSIFRMSQ